MNTLLKLEPGNLSGHGLRASLEDGKKNFPAAVQDLTFIIEKEETGHKRKAFLKARAIDYEKMGAIDKALKDYAQLAADSKHEDGAIFDAARGFDQLGNTDGAIKLIDQLVSQFPDDDEAFKMRGDLYMKKKRYDLALAAYKKAESLDQFDSTIKAAREQAEKLLKAGAK